MEREKTIFFAPDILNTLELPHEEAQHCIRVLRMNQGDEILIADGKGTFYDAIITNAHQKHCNVEIVGTTAIHKHWNFNLHIAFAPTKNIDRTEWFLEKATEIGIDHISPILTAHSERKQVKLDRLEKILVSAMKQSQKATLPKLDDLTSFAEFIQKPFTGKKLIAHCYDTEKSLLKDIYSHGEDVLILIGPEGDFSEEEVNLAMENGYSPISLGESRLRTETAALVACHSIHALNW